MNQLYLLKSMGAHPYIARFSLFNSDDQSPGLDGLPPSTMHQDTKAGSQWRVQTTDSTTLTGALPWISVCSMFRSFWIIFISLIAYICQGSYSWEPFGKKSPQSQIFWEQYNLLLLVYWPGISAQEKLDCICDYSSESFNYFIYRSGIGWYQGIGASFPLETNVPGPEKGLDCCSFTS